jgi:hypothetical protein
MNRMVLVVAAKNCEKYQKRNAATLLWRRTLISQLGYFLKSPNVLSYACFHRRGNAQRLVDAPEIVVHVIDRQRVRVVGVNFPRDGDSSSAPARIASRQFARLPHS